MADLTSHQLLLRAKAAAHASREDEYYSPKVSEFYDAVVARITADDEFYRAVADALCCGEDNHSHYCPNCGHTVDRAHALRRLASARTFDERMEDKRQVELTARIERREER